MALLTPFEHRQLDIGDFVYDATLPAMRATVAGLESGAIDLLITDEDTYELAGARQSPTVCKSLGKVFSPPQRQWMPETAQCAGKGSLTSGMMEWWRMPDDEGAGTWYWYRATTRLPWRSSRMKASSDPAVIGGYAMANFTTFEPLSQTNLAALRNFCRSQNGAPAARPSASETGVRALMKADRAGDEQSASAAATSIAGLDPGACAGVTPPRWPTRFQMSAIMLSTDFNLGPYPTEIFYDAQTRMLTRLHDPEQPSSPIMLDLLLGEEAGLHIPRDQAGASSCKRQYPGMVRQDWMTHGQCQCRAVVVNNPALARNETLRIFSCPVNRDRAFWAAYTASGRPVVFRSTAPVEAGLTLADYYRWSPKAEPPAGVLEPPSVCDKRPLFEFNSAGPFTSCSGCHLTRD